MTKLINNPNNLSLKNNSYIDKQLHKLEPYFATTNDELPLLDIIIAKGDKADAYFASVAVFLPDGSLIAKTQNTSADQALKSAFRKIFRQINAQDKAKHTQKKWWTKQEFNLTPSHHHSLRLQRTLI